MLEPLAGGLAQRRLAQAAAERLQRDGGAMCHAGGRQAGPAGAACHAGRGDDFPQLARRLQRRLAAGLDLPLTLLRSGSDTDWSVP